MGPPTTAPVPNPTAPPTTAPVTPPTSDEDYSYSYSYSYTPVTSPTTAPVPNPTALPTTAPVAAPNDCVEFRITLNTDAYGYETSFTLMNDKGVTRLAGGGYPSSKSVDEVACLANGRYFFTISDSHGDGMCCGENGDG